MKIEKINENQIKCTLNKSDLASRHIKISELAYGSEKAKDLFRDMMQQASYELGFEAEDIPLMIEAIPISADCIILVITKVEDPEELDTRFSKFAPPEDELDYEEDYFPEEPEAKADSVLNLLRSAQSSAEESPASSFTPLADKLNASATPKASNSNTDMTDLCFIYSFGTLDNVLEASNILCKLYQGENTLYKNPDSNVYYLVLHKNTMSAGDFNRVCNILSEYGHKENTYKTGDAYLTEHYKLIINHHALQTLSRI